MSPHKYSKNSACEVTLLHKDFDISDFKLDRAPGIKVESMLPLYLVTKGILFPFIQSIVSDTNSIFRNILRTM